MGTVAIREIDGEWEAVCVLQDADRRGPGGAAAAPLTDFAVSDGRPSRIRSFRMGTSRPR